MAGCSQLARLLAEALGEAGVARVREGRGQVHLDGTTVRLRPTQDPTDVTPDAVFIAGRVPTAVKRRFEVDGAGWVDARSVNVLAPGVVVVAPTSVLAPRGGPQRSVRVLAGPAVTAVTTHALMRWPEPMIGIRALAKLAEVSPGGVSLAATRLVDAGFLTEDRRATRDLFWEAAREWRPRWAHVSVEPAPTSDIVEVGPQVATKLGAPTPATRSAPRVFLAATDLTMRLTMINSREAVARARMAVAPSPLAVQRKGDSPESLAVIVALTLATDQGRGAEIVSNWGGTHVWA